ncbi:MAG: dienelactone hydrolase [Kiritimatiellia bacterium]|jgi:dienelactone hydrolase
MRSALYLAVVLASCDGGPPVVHQSTDDPGTDNVIELVVQLECASTRDAVYTSGGETPEPGRPVACATGRAVSRAAVAVRLEALGSALNARSGYQAYLFSYWTESSQGRPAMATARLLVPELPVSSGALPLVVVNHGEMGLSDLCAPSLRDDALDALALPWIAAGYPVVMPDYRGLGTDGVRGFDNALDTGWSALDSARAARRALVEEGLSGEVWMIGVGQGGGGALAAQSLATARFEDDGLQLTQVVSIAGQLVLRDPSPTYRSPSAQIQGDRRRASMAVALQADLANLAGHDRRGDALHPDVREAVLGATDTLCSDELVSSLSSSRDGYVPPSTLGQLVDPDLRLEIVGCVAQNSRCTDRAQAVVDRNRANQLKLDVDGARILLVVGELDDLQGPDWQACLRDKLDDDAVNHEICVMPSAGGADVVTRSSALVLSWSGVGEEVACPGANTLPRCPYW